MGCGLLYAVSQFGLDLIEGLDGFEARQENWAAALGIDAYGVTHTFAVTEEVLEMAGTTLLWFAFLRYFGIRADGISLRLKRGAGTAAMPALSATTSSPGHVESWSRLVRQAAKVDLMTRRTIHHEDAQTVHGRVQGEGRA
jgi:hypothetical protein